MSIRVDDKEVIRAALERAAGPHAGAGLIADAATACWQVLASRLEPLIGQGGVRALYGRCLHLRGIAEQHGAAASNDNLSPMALRSDLQGRSPADALDAAAGFFQCFSDLLSSLIGAGLTARLLTPVLAVGHHDTPAQENDR